MTIEEAIKRLEIIATNLCGQSAQNPNLWPDYKAVDMAISAIRQQEHFREVTKKVETLTNAQKIRAMSDEELAWELMLWRCEAVARHHGISSVYPDTQKTILEWLQMPAEEGKHEAD